jgi:hypothetical protein
LSKFTVFHLPLLDESEDALRLEGAIKKYWVDLPGIGRSLIKVDLRGGWAEKITATLADRIGLPVAGCELVEREDGLKLIASPTFLLDGATEIPGENLLKNKFGKNYPYTLDAILSAIDSSKVSLSSNFQATSEVATASDLLTGYLVFDSWIGNIDRHCKNWGIQRASNGTKELLPTYDHGLSLGAMMPEDKLPLDLMDFSGDCRSSIQGKVRGMMNMNDLATSLLDLRPSTAVFWIDRIAAIDRQAIEEIFARMPAGWISDIRSEFAVNYLDASRDRLVSANQ